MGQPDTDLEPQVNTSVRVPVSLRDLYVQAVKAENPEMDASKDLRRYMRERVERHREAERAPAALAA